jgi:hypothetical protein
LKLSKIRNAVKFAVSPLKLQFWCTVSNADVADAAKFAKHAQPETLGVGQAIAPGQFVPFCPK